MSETAIEREGGETETGAEKKRGGERERERDIKRVTHTHDDPQCGRSNQDDMLDCWTGCAKPVKHENSHEVSHGAL